MANSDTSKPAKDSGGFSRLRWAFTSGRKREKLLADTKRILRLLPETAALLDLADARGIDIRLDGDMIGTEDSGLTAINRTTGNISISIKPYKTPEDTVIALIHELRHVWQIEKLGITPMQIGLVESDARAALMFTRVREADAYAYTDLVIARLNNAQLALQLGAAEEKRLYAQNNGAPLTEVQQDAVSDIIAAQISKNIPVEKNIAAASFERALATLQFYDHEAMANYRRRYIDDTPPLRHLTSQDGHALTVADLRKLTVAGEGPTFVSYLDHLDDAAFAALVLKDVAPEIKEAADLMGAFEKAATAEKKQAARTRLDSTFPRHRI